MLEELNKPMPHAERQALIERLRAEGVEMPDDVKNHVVNGGASAQNMLSAHMQSEERPLEVGAGSVQGGAPWWAVAASGLVGVVVVGLVWLIF